MKTFGLVVPPATGSKFERQVEALLADHADLRRVIGRCSRLGMQSASPPRSWGASCWLMRDAATPVSSL